MKPIGKNIVIKSIEEEIVTESGLLLSADDASNLRYKKGLVVKPGTDVNVIKENDSIYYDKRSGYTMLIDGTAYTIISENDIVVVLWFIISFASSHFSKVFIHLNNKIFIHLTFKTHVLVENRVIH